MFEFVYATINPNLRESTKLKSQIVAIAAKSMIELGPFFKHSPIMIFPKIVKSFLPLFRM